MKKPACLVLFLSLSLFSFSQISVAWQQSFGEPGYNSAFCIRQTSDGGFVVAGGSQSEKNEATGHHGNNDFLIAKFNSYGQPEWKKYLGGSGDEVAYSVQQTNDGGYVMAGFSQSNDGDVSGNHGGQDYWIVKLSRAGIIQWQKCFGGKKDDLANAIHQTGDGGYLVAGYSNSVDGDVTANHGLADAWIIKLDESGKLIWQKSFGGSGTDVSSSMLLTSDGGFVFAGWSDSGDENVPGNHGGLGDCWIVRADKDGIMQWQKTLGGSGDDNALSVNQTDDGGFVLAGCSESGDGDVGRNRGGYDYWIVKLSDFGAIEWEQSIGGSADDVATSVQQTFDGGYILVGASGGGSEQNDSWIIKLNRSGMVERKNSIGGVKNQVARFIWQDQDGNYVVAGWVLSADKLDAKKGYTDFWIAKLTNHSVMKIVDGNDFVKYELSPNPEKQYATVSFSLLHQERVIIKIYDLEGREIKSLLNETMLEGNHRVNWDLTDQSMTLVSNGMYLMHVDAGDFSQAIKINVLK